MKKARKFKITIYKLYRQNVLKMLSRLENTNKHIINIFGENF